MSRKGSNIGMMPKKSRQNTINTMIHSIGYGNDPNPNRKASNMSTISRELNLEKALENRNENGALKRYSQQLRSGMLGMQETLKKRLSVSDPQEIKTNNVKILSTLVKKSSTP